MSSRFTGPQPSLTELLQTFGLVPPVGDSLASQETSPAVSPSVTSSSGNFFTTVAAFNEWLEQLVHRKGASDIYFSPYGIHLRLNQTITPLSDPVGWTANASETILKWLTERFVPGSVMAERFRVRLQETGAADTSWLAGAQRFRVSVFYTSGQLSFIFRRIPPGIRHFSHLSLPPALFTCLLQATRRGLLLITGNADSGKSATLSACIGFWNDHRPGHIVVLEDPMEYFYESRLALIHQREVGVDSSSMAESIRTALRQFPDIIVVGEIRDVETARLLLHAAGTGCLVASTIEAPHTFGALQQFTAFFPENEQSQVWSRLVRVFSLVVGQTLLPTISSTLSEAKQAPADCGNAFSHSSFLPAVEILRNSPAMTHLLASPRCTRELVMECMERSRDEYMITMDDYLHLLLATGRISLEAALSAAHSPSGLKLRVSAENDIPPSGS